MRRIIGPLIILVIGLFVVNLFLTTNTDTSLSDLIKAGTQTTQPATGAPQPPVDSPKPHSPAATAPKSAQGALASLESIPVTTAARIPPYDRGAQFTPGGRGSSWPDVDGNSCDTRNDVLARDLTGTTRPDGCKVTSGTLLDPYTGKTIAFERDVVVNGKKVSGNSQAVQIDHVVALSLAWKSGAYAWTQNQRVAFANDPANLLASDGPANNRKRDRGPGSWLPSVAGNPAYDCPYAQNFVAVLAKYDLTATAQDATALKKTLQTCP